MPGLAGELNLDGKGAKKLNAILETLVKEYGKEAEVSNQKTETPRMPSYKFEGEVAESRLGDAIKKLLRPEQVRRLKQIELQR